MQLVVKREHRPNETRGDGRGQYGRLLVIPEFEEYIFLFVSTQWIIPIVEVMYIDTLNTSNIPLIKSLRVTLFKIKLFINSGSNIIGQHYTILNLCMRVTLTLRSL